VSSTACRASPTRNIATVIEIAGAIYGAVLVRHFWTLPPLLRAAVFAQIADVVSFVWAGRPAEDRNPLANLIHQAFSGVTSDTSSELGHWLTALVVIGLKTGLIFYLVWAAPKLRQYQRTVLVLAIAAGLIGALSNSPALTDLIPAFG
jgi:hypothetical protein